MDGVVNVSHCATIRLKALCCCFLALVIGVSSAWPPKVAKKPSLIMGGSLTLAGQVNEVKRVPPKVVGGNLNGPITQDAYFDAAKKGMIIGE